MRRTVYRFRCTRHTRPLQGHPEFVWDPAEQTAHLDLNQMGCPSNMTGDECQQYWSIQTCDHIHPNSHVPAGSKCNSMTCWNYRHSHKWSSSNGNGNGNGNGHKQVTGQLQTEVHKLLHSMGISTEVNGQA